VLGDDGMHIVDVETGDLRQHADRAIDVLGVLADDGNRERVPIVDEHLAVSVVKHTARRAQRERPLVIVCGHFLVLGVLDDLQEPEADAERGKHDHAGHLQYGEPDSDAPAIFLYGHMFRADL
jgi:hypothetical protein